MKSPVIVALDFAHKKQALDFVAKITPSQCRLKVGKEMFTHFGPAFVKQLVALGFDVFLDLKFHDIPNTVAKACQAAADLGVWMMNVHASGGRNMLQASSKALQDSGHDKPLLIAVTVLTSLDQPQLNELGISLPLNEYALRLAKLSQECGLDGVVCSAMEAESMKQHLGSEFKLVTPGIRLDDSKQDDQVRVMTPIDAQRAGSDYLVIGRPITQSENPAETLIKINNQLIHQ